MTMHHDFEQPELPSMRSMCPGYMHVAADAASNNTGCASGMFDSYSKSSRGRCLLLP
jgi:hypothetical protein